MKMNPVYKREMMVSARSLRMSLIITVFNSILAVVALLNMYSNVVQVRITADVQYGSFLDLYEFVACVEFIMLMFIMPAITSGTISGERERQTLDLMLTTKMKSWEIVTGKLAADRKAGCCICDHVPGSDFQFPGNCHGICVWRDYLGKCSPDDGLLCGICIVCGQPGNLLLFSV